MTPPNRVLPAVAALATLAALLALGACSPPAADRPSPSSRRPAAPTTSSTTTTAAIPSARGAAGLATTDRLERRHRLAQALPHATAHYRIDFTVAADGRLALRVTLLAVLNGPRDLARYEAELARYRAEALAFIAAQGDDPASYTVTFHPPDP